MPDTRVGLWLVGGNGGVATTTILGLAALRRGLVDTTGLVSASAELSDLPLAGLGSFVVGGHEIRRLSLAEEARRLARDHRAVDPGLVEACAKDLGEIDARIVPGTLWNVGPTITALAARDSGGFQVPDDPTPRAAVERLGQDLLRFRSEHDLDHVVVVNVASTEPPCDATRLPKRWEDFEPLLDLCDAPLPASTLYAIAAMEAGAGYINFTPSLGSAPPALDELACRCGTCHMGCDGKTGETLMKSVLAPMFRHRNLRVMSWVGHNIFGNLDGKVLDDPVNKGSKVTSKDRLVRQILGYSPQTLVSIEYIESLGDWKTAWDHIHFAGFLGTPMTLQFVWQGCDSLLAAPLVIDLARLAELAHRRGDRGRLGFLAPFFKSPYGIDEHDFARQTAMLLAWADAVRRDG